MTNTMRYLFVCPACGVAYDGDYPAFGAAWWFCGRGCKTWNIWIGGAATA